MTTTDTSLRRTPIYDRHIAHGGKVVPFAGWELPVRYAGIIEEHNAVRTRAGIFDVSHMGEIWVTGEGAEKALDYLTCNNVRSMYDGRAQYTALLNERGGVVDDLIIYRFSPTKYLLCVNASNAQKDFEWMVSKNTFDAAIKNVSSEFGQVAIQGPNAIEIVAKYCNLSSLNELGYFHFVEAKVNDVPLIIARTGYTGEDGCEIFVPWNETGKIWDDLIKLGATPCGLGARDTLRLEACYPLHGHELGDDKSALESGLGWIIKFDKGNFIGRDSLLSQKNAGLKKQLVGFFLDDAGIVRENEKVFSKTEEEIGITTSGTKTPTINRALGLALVDPKHSKVGEELLFNVRGKFLKGRIVPIPFYKRTPC